jgi:hypothetical protein
MEHQWSRAVAISGNRWQVGTFLKQAETVAVGCDWLPIGAHGKGALPPCYGGGHLSCSAREVESREPEGSQDSSPMLSVRAQSSGRTRGRAARRSRLSNLCQGSTATATPYGRAPTRTTVRFHVRWFLSSVRSRAVALAT